MSDVIRIAQITDCHLPADPKRAYRGIDPYKNLQTLLTKVKSLKPDLILASGDLSEDGSQVSYTALKHLLNSIDVPVLALPGNHDDAARVHRFDLLRELNSADAGQSNIEKDEVRRIISHSVEHLITVAGRTHTVLSQLKVLANSIEDFRVVVDQ